MKKHARENLRKRRNRQQKEQHNAYAKRIAEKKAVVAAAPPPAPQPTPPPRDTLLDFFESALVGIPGILIISARGVVQDRLPPDFLDAEPGSFRELTQKINE